MIILIDNYDSFTYNLYHYIGIFTDNIEVWRNDKITVTEIIAKNPKAIVLSPGPKTPNDAGICLDLIKQNNGNIPILGVCLGHQAIAQVYGANIINVKKIKHGKISSITHIDNIIFNNIPKKFNVTRYHSLTVDPKTFPNCLKVTAVTNDGVIMAFSHINKQIHGVQFHPESIASEYGHLIIANFLKIAGIKILDNSFKLNKININKNLFSEFKPFITAAADGKIFTQKEIKNAFEIIMSGNASDVQIASFLMALRIRGETIEEIIGAVSIIQKKSIKIKVPKNTIDICGTGGDNIGTYNISTAASFVIAGCGVTIAKHGNRAVSSLSGSSDILAALGVDITINTKKVIECINEIGIGFLYSIKYHTAMRFVSSARKQLGIRNIFNLLGPLSSPANVKHQVIGVFSKKWLHPIANVLKILGSKHVWIVCGSDGLDELTITGLSYVVELKNNIIKEFKINPIDYGIKISPIEELKGGDAKFNALVLYKLLQGEKSAYRDITILNTAAGLIVSGKVNKISEGIKLAKESIDSGSALLCLKKLIEISNK